MSLRSTRLFARTESWLAARRPFVLVVVVTALASACANLSPTAPALDELAVRPRKTEYRCVAQSPDGDSTVVAPVPEDGDCPAGFDLIPWW